ncbi:hypothetical protein KUV73_24625 [Mameliella alba]|nr:hypothetical protein [Mameliella alba]MBY6172591.1 hypothetical protein [Mameliella alba]MBY6177573.1 hypothetical protein [Mameliella alba]
MPPARPPAISDPDEYRALLRDRFALSEETAGAALCAAQETLPRMVQVLQIGLHLDQDGEGGFDVWLHAVGPDQFVLNKAIAPYRTLFEGRCFAFDGKLANLPGFDPENLPFDFPAIIADEGFAWAGRLWDRFGDKALGSPVEVFAENGWTEELRPACRLHKGPGC